MDIRKLYYWHRRLLFLKAWYFLVLAVAFGLLAVHGLRSNYARMAELRESVYAADQQNGDVEKALNELRSHVHGHMNTNLSGDTNAIKPPIQLKARYERLAAVENERIKAANEKIAAQGEQVCAAQFPAAGFNASRVDCVQQYVSQNALKSSSVPDSLYKFDFVSPRWSPDLAGFSILFSIIFFILFIARVATEYIIRRRLH